MEQNNNNNFEENIRDPDKVIFDQLIEDTRSYEDKQIDEAILKSLEDIQIFQKEMESYEQRILYEYQNESIRRSELFADLLLNMNKIAIFDKEIKEIYNIIEPIISLYCSQYIEKYDMDEVTYDKIFNILGTIRMKPKDIINLKSILFTSDN